MQNSCRADRILRLQHPPDLDLISYLHIPDIAAVLDRYIP